MALSNKYHTGFVLLIILIFFFIMANSAFAETKVFVEEYTYQASEYDSKVSCRTLAREQVKRLLLEKLGTYLESETEVKNLQLTKDRIVMLTAGIVSDEIIDEKWDGKTYYLRAKITADPNDVVTSIEKLRQDRQQIKELEEVRKTANELLREVERLKKELELAKKDQTKIVRYDEAIKELSAKDWFEKGYALVIAGKDQEAMGAFTKSIELDPRFSMAYSNRSMVYGNLGIYQQALADANKAIELDPRNAPAYVNRGLACFKLGNHQQVLADANKAIELDPRFSMAYVNRSAAYSMLGNAQQALADANKAIELDPRNALAYVNRGLACFKLGEYRQAIIDYGRAIEINPKLEAYVNRGLAYGKLGNYPQAITDFDKAIEVNPKDGRAYMSRGATKALLGDHQQAIKDIERGIELNPKDAGGYYIRGITYGALGDYRQAIKDYDKAIELNPNFAEAYRNRGVAYDKSGNAQEAIRNYKKACELGDKGACEMSSSYSHLNNFPKTEQSNSNTNLRIFKPGDYINYKLTGFVNVGGVDVPILGTAQYQVLNDTQVDYYGNQCKIFRLSMDFTAVGKDPSARAKRFSDHYFTQDSNGSLMIHGNKDSESGILSFVKTPPAGWYLAFKCPFTARESVSQNIELTSGSSENRTDMMLSEERIFVPAGVFSAVKAISNTFTTNTDSSKVRSMETNWLVPEIGPVRANVEYSSDKASMKFILEMTDTNIPHEAEPPAPAAKTGPGEYRDTATGMEFVLVKGGCYQMGETFGNGYGNEKPVHEVCVDDFYLGKYEVTQGQWRAMMGSNPSVFKNCGAEGWEGVAPETDKNGGRNCPVENVSWNDVQEFISRLNQRSGKRFRLPTEAEWEYAARSRGKMEKWSGTSSQGELGLYAWYEGNSGSRTHPVGGKRPNGLGLYDMSGNVWEWCSDWYNEYYYRNSLKNNPKGPENGESRVLRGGSWGDDPVGVRAAARGGIVAAIGFNNVFGFRLGASAR